MEAVYDQICCVFTVCLLVCFTRCDTENSSIDRTIGHFEVISRRTAQHVGGTVATAPETRTKIIGVAVVGCGVALEDGRQSISRAEPAMGDLPRFYRGGKLNRFVTGDCCGNFEKSECHAISSFLLLVIW